MMKKQIFKTYSPRSIAFKELVKVDNWKIKIYTISTKENFEADEVLEQIVQKLSDLLKPAQNHHSIAFVIIHEANDGIWTLVNWWMGGNMLRTITYFTSFDKPNELELYLKSGSLSCVWEMLVIQYERDNWVKYILKKTENPDFNTYLSDNLKGKL